MAQYVWLLTLPPLLISLAACADARPGPSGGSIGYGLQVSPDATVAMATYTLLGPNGFASAGSVPVGESPDVPVVLSHLPVGAGYQLELSAIASDGVIECDGTATFDVVDANATLTVIVHLECAVPTGDLDLQATVNVCPVLDGLSASPLALQLGGVSSLVMTAHDSDQAPAPLKYAWTVNGFKLPGQQSPNLSFVCSSPGEVTIVASVSDGHPDPTCADTESVRLSCQ